MKTKFLNYSRFFLVCLFSTSLLYAVTPDTHTEETTKKPRGLFSSLGNFRTGYQEQFTKVNILKDNSCLGWDFSGSEIKLSTLIDPESAFSKAMDRLLPESRMKILDEKRATALVVGDTVVFPLTKLMPQDKVPFVEKTRYAEFIRDLTRYFDMSVDNYLANYQKSQSLWGQMDFLGTIQQAENLAWRDLANSFRALKESGAPTAIVQEAYLRFREASKGKRLSNATAWNSIPLLLPAITSPGEAVAGCTKNNEEILSVKSEIVLGQKGTARFQIFKNGAKAIAKFFDKNGEQARLASKANSFKGKGKAGYLSASLAKIEFTPTKNDPNQLRVTMSLEDGNSVSFPSTVNKSDLEEGAEISLQHVHTEGISLILAAEVLSDVKLRWDKVAKRLIISEAKATLHLNDRHGSETDSTTFFDLETKPL